MAGPLSVQETTLTRKQEWLTLICYALTAILCWVHEVVLWWVPILALISLIACVVVLLCTRIPGINPSVKSIVRGVFWALQTPLLLMMLYYVAALLYEFIVYLLFRTHLAT